MAKATAYCTCNACGSTFTLTKVCKNSKEADSWTKWVAEQNHECDECREKRIAAERSEKAEEAKKTLSLPAITGVSEKQVKYAEDLRDKYITSISPDIESSIKKALALRDTPEAGLDKLNARRIKRGEEPLTVEENVNRMLEFADIRTAYTLLTESSAKTIIETLK